jgi:3-oxoacyl-[acyl-carrier protein] reductase
MGERIVVVTGAGRGIGRAICRRFAKEGAHIVAAARSTEDLLKTQRIVESEGGRCHTRSVDVSKPDQIEGWIADTIEQCGRIDVLINNAGVAPLAPIEKLTRDVFAANQKVNVEAVYYACRAVWPAMVKQGGGVIISMSSFSSVDPFPGFTAYGAAKAWVNAWTRGLADEGRAVGIRVFAVAPAAVETGMLRSAFPDFPADQTLDPGDVAEMVFTLAQPGCRHATGQTLFVKK